LVTSAVILLAIPVVQLVAAGLYNALPFLNTKTIPIEVDTSLPDHIVPTFNISSYDPIVRRASEFTEWTSIPSFDVRERAGIINNTVLSNITSVTSSLQGLNQTDGEINVRVPANAVDVECTPIPNEAFNLEVTYNSHIPNWVFTWYCRSAPCSTLLNQTVAVHQSSARKGYPPPSRYEGSSFTQDPDLDPYNAMNNFELPALVNTAYNVILADLSSITAGFDSIQNKSLMDVSGNRTSNTMRAGPDTFSFPLPTLRALSCTRNLTMVQVNATFARSTKLLMGGVETILPWSPIAIDPSSLSRERAYPTMQPFSFAPVTQIPDQYTQFDKDMDGLLTSDSLWPKVASPTNFWQLLAAYAEFQADNLTSLLDADKLAAAAKDVLTAYSTQILTQLRPLALSSAPASQTAQPFQGTLKYPELRLSQDLGATIALEGLFALMLCCVVWVFIQFPSESIPPKPPDSIAARLSLLANSSIVRRLREERISDLKGMDIGRETAALGWWLKDNRNGNAQATIVHHDGQPAQWRWGIDVGPDMILRSWNSPPTAAEAASLLKLNSQRDAPSLASRTDVNNDDARASGASRHDLPSHSDSVAEIPHV
jgi:hypothetical protein